MMRNGLRFKSFLFALLIAGLASSPLLLPTGAAQSPTDKASKGRDFGSSLKRQKEAELRPDAETPGRSSDEGAEPSEDRIIVETLLVVLDVLVTDRSGSRFINGLGKDDFIIIEDDRPQQIETFTLGDDAARLPRSIVLIFDRSDSQLPYLEESIKAAKKLVDQLAPTDEMAIVTDDVQLAVDFTKDKKRLKQVLDSLKKLTLEGYRTRSMQFSALLATLRELVDIEKKRPIIILQTDGDEAERLGKFDAVAGKKPFPEAYAMTDVYREVERSRTKIYTVIPGERLIGIPEEELMERWRQISEKGQRAAAKRKDMWYGYRRLPPEPTAKPKMPALSEAQILKLRESVIERVIDMAVRGQTAAVHVAELTGGWASFLERPEQASEIYGRILSDINSRYVIGYYPTNKARDGRLRTVRVEVKGHPDYVVHGRRSYYAKSR